MTDDNPTTVDVRCNGRVIGIENENLFPFRDSTSMTRGEAEELRDQLTAALEEAEDR